VGNSINMVPAGAIVLLWAATQRTLLSRPSHGESLTQRLLLYKLYRSLRRLGTRRRN
jgi:hypothetical protein